VALAALVGLGTVGWYALGGDADAPPPTAGTSAEAEPTAPRFLAFALTGTAQPYLALVGSGGDPPRAAAIPVPPELTVVVPGQGETTATNIAALSPQTIQVALSNEFGVWAGRVAVLDVSQVSAAVDRAGGLTMELDDVFATSAGVLGPGRKTLSGPKVAALLSSKAPDSAERWRAVLGAWLADPPVLTPADLVEGSSPAADTQEALEAAADARVLAMPTQDIAGAATVSAQPALDGLMSSTWGTTPPTPVIVQNGNGTPGVGERVARMIVPAGFRITLSQNAESFDVETTNIIANGAAYATQAQAVRRALGVGRVGQSQVPSGIGDILIIVGKDFPA
jgi:hypothetical protein